MRPESTQQPKFLRLDTLCIKSPQPRIGAAAVAAHLTLLLVHNAHRLCYSVEIDVAHSGQMLP